MSKSLLALVWIAGPLSGTLVQPYIGIRSDNSRISWGKRRPFMLVGAAVTALSLLLLAWTREIVQGFMGFLGADPKSRGVQVSSIVFATALVYILDVGVNTGNYDQDPILISSPRHSLCLQFISPGRDSCFHRRQCADASARRCQFLGWPTHRYWKYSWLCCRIRRSAKSYGRHLWRYTIQSLMRHRLVCSSQHRSDI